MSANEIFKMYNNIGLQTARGSGTNGYVQRNLSLLRSRKEKVEYHTQQDVDMLEQMNTRKPNQEILEHERKRQVELKCMELQDMMEEQGYNENEILTKVEELRRILAEKESVTAKDKKEGKANITETHQLAEATEEKNARMKEALGIKDGYKDGSSFNQNQEVKEIWRESEPLVREARQEEVEKEREQREQEKQR